MAIGKKEQIAVILVAAIAVAALVHFFIFAKRAETYKSTQERYSTGVQTLQNAEIIEPDQEDEFRRYEATTAQYSDLVSSAVAALNLQAPARDPQTSPPVGAVDQWASETIQLLANLMDQSASSEVRLTFLGNSRDQLGYATGWNMPRQLPNHTKDVVTRANELQYAFAYMQRSANPQIKLNSRYQYNVALEGLGLPPVEVAFFRYPSQQWFYFDEEDLLGALLPGYNAQNASAQMAQYFNTGGLQVLGVAVPALRKIWAYHLIRQSTQGIPNFNLQAVGEALKINVPLDNNTVDVINKQLRGLLDIIALARKNRITEISQVRLLRPVDLVKGDIRQPGVIPSPTPAVATPAVDSMMMMDPTMMGDPLMGLGLGMDMAAATPVPDADKIGTGTGIELWFRGTNNNVVGFMYDLTHITRTYSLDDIDIITQPNAPLSTSVTVELVTQVDKLTGGAGAGDMAADPAAGVPVQ